VLLNQDVEQKIVESLKKYNTNFKTKQFTTKEMDTDILMDFFNISFETKAKNIQYWNRELGMIWELVQNIYFR
jgi:apaLI-like restriction endonuclease